MVVVPEPAVKGCGAFGAVAVDRRVCPAVEHGADEAFGLAVGLRAAWPCAEVADAVSAASDRVDGRAVGGAVISEDPLDADAIAGEEGKRAVEETDRGAGFFIAEDLGVGEATVIVDGDVDVVPAAEAAIAAVGITAARSSLVGRALPDAFAGHLETAELFDVDVDELAGRERSYRAGCSR